MNHTVKTTPAPAGLEFEITNLNQPDNQTSHNIAAEFDLKLPGVTLHRCRLVRRRESPDVISVKPPSDKDRFSPSGWRNHATLDAKLTFAVRDAILQQLGIKAAAS